MAADPSAPPSAEPSPAQTPPRSKARTPEQLSQDAADRELMRQVVAADEEAFGSFYRRFAPALFSMIYNIVQDQKAAEDVLQESFVQMWKKASSYDGGRSSVFTWAVMISRNRAIDRLRSRQRRARTAEAAAVEASVQPQFNCEQPDDLLGEGDERNRIRNALSHLPDAQRDAINLAFFRGLTQAEISTEIGAPLGTVKARIRRGLLALRDILEPSP